MAAALIFIASPGLNCGLKCRLERQLKPPRSCPQRPNLPGKKMRARRRKLRERRNVFTAVARVSDLDEPGRPLSRSAARAREPTVHVVRRLGGVRT